MHIAAGQLALFFPKVVVLVAQATSINETLADLFCGVVVPAGEGTTAAPHLARCEAIFFCLLGGQHGDGDVGRAVWLV